MRLQPRDFLADIAVLRGRRRLLIEPLLIDRQVFEQFADALVEVLHYLDAGLLGQLRYFRHRGLNVAHPGTRVRNIETAVAKIAQLAEQTRVEIMENFHKRIRELLEDLPVNEKRLYEEASSASQHGDISEEINGLKTHLEGLKSLLKRKGQVGKSIEFLLQEINREVNTMGSKSQNAALSQVTVEVKAEPEKMREQVQNVE